MGSEHKHASDACCPPPRPCSPAWSTWCACVFCVVLVALFACVPHVAAADVARAADPRARPLRALTFVTERAGKRALSGAEVIAILAVYDEDNDGFLSEHEFEHYYHALIPDHVAHISEEVHVDSEIWSVKMAALTNGSADFFVDEGAALCLNESAVFELYDADRNDLLDQTEIAAAAAHLTLIVAYCEPEHEELPLCVTSPAEAWGYGLLAAFLISLISLLGVIFLPFNFKAAKLPLMQLLLALAVGALIGDSILHILPEIFGAHSHGNSGSDSHGHGHAHEHSGHSAAEERLEALRTYLGPSLIICLTILMLFLVEKLIMKLAGGHGHGHSHGGPDSDDEDDEDEGKGHGHSHSHHHHHHHHHRKRPHLDPDDTEASNGKRTISKIPHSKASNTSSSKSSSTVSKLSSASDPASESSHSNGEDTKKEKENDLRANGEVIEAEGRGNGQEQSESSSERDEDTPNILKNGEKVEGMKEEAVHEVIDLETESKSEEMDMRHVKPVGWFFIVADLMHNCVDGLLLGFAFSAGPQNGLVAAIAVLLHEIPKELGTFALLIQAGFSRKRALMVNFGASATLFAGTIIGLSVGSIDQAGIRWVLSVVVGAFLYLAVAEIIPQLQSVSRTPLIVSLQTIGILVGFVALFLIALFETHGDVTCRRP